MKILTKNGLKTQTWQWTSNYRIWEANQKVFLYPENWLTPELKDDKSPLFEDLEKELLKSRISASHLSQQPSICAVLSCESNGLE